jgi:hypothetical protein
MSETTEQAGNATSHGRSDLNDDLSDIASTTHFDPATVDAIAIGALDEDAAGQRVRKVITTKDFIPGRDTAWIIQHVCTQPKGTYVRLGFLAGFITGCHRSQTDWQGKSLQSVWLEGMFEATLGATGEVIQAPNLILPLAYGELVEGAFKQASNQGIERMQAELDVEIGVEATGRSIPYEWVVISYVTGEAQRALRAVRKRQAARLAKQKETPPALAKPDLQAIAAR